MLKKAAFFSFFIFTTFHFLYAQRDTLNLSKEWLFAIDKQGVGMASQWYAAHHFPGDARSIHVPHTWNVEEANQKHYGWGWYQRSIPVPKHWKGKKVVLQFGAINHTAHIYLNGVKIKENTGDGFNKFFVPLTDQLLYGKDNIITVAVNNDYGNNKVPFGNSFDWPNDGGIIREVLLITTPQQAASYIHLTPLLHLTDSSADLQVKLLFDQRVNPNVKFKIDVQEENQPTATTVFSNVVKPQVHNSEAVAQVHLPKIRPWHFDHCNLYKVVVTVLSGDKILDRIVANTGFRTFEYKNTKAYLNGEQVKLMGVEWTAGSHPDYGLAEPHSEIIRYAKLMKEVNCIFSRVHFQQDDVFYDFCDRNGILLQEEIPLWGGDTPVNDTIATIAYRQIAAMIRNHYNHPSIIHWGVGNELRGRDEKMKNFIATMIAKVKALDATRYAIYVSNSIKDGYFTTQPFVPDAGSLGDVILMNEYGGSWWSVPVAEIGAYMDSIHSSYSDKPFMISEFGLCEPNFKGGDERRITDLIYHMALYESKPYVQGAIYFDLTDYRTHYPGTQEDNRFRRRVHGVYDMYGNAKPSALVLREQSAPVEVHSVNQWKKGKVSIVIWGSIGLPQHTVTGYKLYISASEKNYEQTKAYSIPVVAPGSQVVVEADDLYNGGGIITIVRPNGYIVSQKNFYNLYDNKSKK